ncbi:MAG: MerR family transcriptional regulator [Pseudomonadota bacterium]|nr:MerR family transcriptional regulator [Pseudomonadota bacterium]
MPSTHHIFSAAHVELLGDAPLSGEQLASGCRMTLQWVHTHVEAGVLSPASGGEAAEWRFASATLLRARRIAHLEQAFDADPQLAALTTDLMEEVARLRKRLNPP